VSLDGDTKVAVAAAVFSGSGGNYGPRDAGIRCFPFLISAEDAALFLTAESAAI
jgi:hypothetical protein